MRFLLIVLALACTGCEDATPAPPPAATVAPRQQIDRQIRVILDRFDELRSELPPAELDELRALAIELYRQHDDPSAVSLWATNVFMWEQHRLNLEQDRLRQLFESTPRGMFDEDATIVGITLAMTRLEDARSVALVQVDLYEQFQLTMRQRLTESGLDEHLVDKDLEYWDQRFESNAYAANHRLMEQTLRLTIQQYQLLIDHPGQWTFVAPGELEGPDVLVGRFNQLEAEKMKIYLQLEEPG